MRIVKYGAFFSGLLFLLPLSGQTLSSQRISLGGDAVMWAAPDLDSFSMAVSSPAGAEVHEMDSTVLYGVRPFVRFGLLQWLDIELSHEFAFGDETDLMVSSASGIVRPFGEGGLELHASICYGQLKWDGPGNFDSNWGWEIGAGYNFRFTDSLSLLIGVAYRDLAFDYDVSDAIGELMEKLPEGTESEAIMVALSEEEVDAAGVVASAGVLVTF